tara:strand:- start:117 stop:977 length:861 start_codon:yes stop_codon:yes gene_type:complete
MKDKHVLNRYLNKLFIKYRFVVVADESFEEKASVKSSVLGVVSGFVVAVLIVIFFTVISVSYTPLNKHIPGKSSEEVQQKLISLSLKSDSLEKILVASSFYLDNIKKIISNSDMSVSNNVDAKNTNLLNAEIIFEKSKEDSLLRIAVETEEKSSIYQNKKYTLKYLVFFSPVNGLISDSFNLHKKHYGVDLVSKDKTKIRSVLDGTVVLSDWNPETGFVIGVQHQNNYLSFYKHNSTLLKEVGDFVVAGESIAVIGNSGELSSGSHLHFELWHNGVPVNPLDYISF